VLIRQAPPAVADGYAAGRLARDGGRSPGAVRGLDTAALLARIGALDA
jgi:hypothetical protein